MTTQIPASEIYAFLMDQRPDLVAFLKKLLEQESPTSTHEAQTPLLDQIAGFLSNLGYEVEIIPGSRSGGHLRGRAPLPDGRPSQLLLGHCDTVWPIGTLQQMPIVQHGNRLRGPGVYDMKAGLVQMLYALKAVSDFGLEPAVAPVVFINSDEEIGSPDSQPYIEELAKSANRAFVLEPSLGPSGKLKTARKGVGKFTIDLIGKSAHAGLEPEKGSSAILELSFLIQKLFALNDPAKGITVNVGTIEGGLRPNVVAPLSKAVVDVRTPNMEDAQRIEKAIFNLHTETPGVAIRVTGSMGRKPLERTPRNQALWRRALDLASDLNLNLEQGTAGGGSDGNLTSQFTATLDGLGAVGDGAHAEHEFVYVDKMIERSALLALLVMTPPLDP